MRYVLLDRITSLDVEGPDGRRAATGIKCVSLADDCFVDHFPGHPVMPGALVLEALAQLAGVLLEATLRKKGRHDLHAVLTMADRARFRHVVVPGDKLRLEAALVQASEDGGRLDVVARVDDAADRDPAKGSVAVEATLTFVLARVTNPQTLQVRRDYLNIWLHGSTEEKSIDAQLRAPGAATEPA